MAHSVRWVGTSSHIVEMHQYTHKTYVMYTRLYLNTYTCIIQGIYVYNGTVLHYVQRSSTCVRFARGSGRRDFRARRVCSRATQCVTIAFDVTGGGGTRGPRRKSPDMTQSAGKRIRSGDLTAAVTDNDNNLLSHVFREPEAATSSE